MCCVPEKYKLTHNLRMEFPVLYFLSKGLEPVGIEPLYADHKMECLQEGSFSL